MVRHAHLELPGVIPMRQGIRLLPVGDYLTGDDLMGTDTASEPGGTGPDW
jgi:hypothetical protein